MFLPSISFCRSTQESSALPVIPKNDQNPASGFVFSNKNKVLDNSHTPVGTWGNQLTYQPVSIYIVHGFFDLVQVSTKIENGQSKKCICKILAYLSNVI